MPTVLQMIGTPGRRVGESIGALTEQNGRKVFFATSSVMGSAIPMMAIKMNFGT
jgi:hypothetical protein